MLSKEADQLLTERFGQDALIALATVQEGIPYVRTVDAYYQDGAFYVITHARSTKMLQIAENPMVAICGHWFSGHGKGESLGWFNSPENRQMAQTLRSVFSAWIDNGHNDFADPNTIILRITLTDGLLFSHGVKYTIG